jgi:hypothetical protein
VSESLTSEEAQAIVDRSAEFCVAVHTGNRVDLVARNEYGQLTVDTYVDAVGERRLLPITESRFADLVVRYEARREPVEDSPFATEEEDLTVGSDDA